MASPKIESVIAHEVIVPTHPGATNSPVLGLFADDWDKLPIVLLEFRISDGITALGEVGRGQTIKSLEPWLRQLPGVQLRGPTLGVLPGAWRTGYKWGLLTAHPPALYDSPSPVSYALEMALYDWAGKRLGCKLVDLLGGAVRERVPVDYWCGRQLPADLTRLVTQAREHGFNGIKTKSKIGDPTLAQVRAIREAGGDTFHITIDPMWQWLSPKDALPMLKTLEPYAEHLQIEDPFPWDQPEMWQRARQNVSVPLVLHTRTVDVLKRALLDQYADGFNCSGGINEFLTMAHAVEVAGYTCWHGSSLEMGVGQAAIIHKAAAARACSMPSDLQAALIRVNTLVTWDWPYQNGSLPLPPGDGIGVELDMPAVEHYRVAYAEFQPE